MSKIQVPLTVSTIRKGNYIRNYKLATKKSGRLMLFAGDQKIEHLNNDFYGKGIHQDDANPEHLFRIASKAKVGVFATQLGLISRYGRDYKYIPYLVKLNSKTNLITTKQRDPQSKALIDVEQVIKFKKQSGLAILGVGYTLYPGSEYEAEALREAQQAIFKAHQHGLITVLWIYPRGKAVKDEKSSHLIAGMVGIASSLGADFVKVTYPKNPTKKNIQEIINAAGRTKVIFSGGSSINSKTFLKTLRTQLDNGAMGNATGRNIHQKSLKDAIAIANAIASISIYDYKLTDTYRVLEGRRKLH